MASCLPSGPGSGHACSVTRGPSADAALRAALSCFPVTQGAEVEPLGRGLINQTFRVRAAGTQYVLQRVSPIFDPAIHRNIRAVTERLAAQGVQTPRLLDTRAGRPWADLGEAGVWRLMTFVDGVGFDTVQSLAQARAAGAMVARFHGALDDLRHEFVGMRRGVHDTPQHLETLRRALRESTEHRLYHEVLELASSILEAAERLEPLPSTPPRVCHGDLKFNNLLFAGSALPSCEQALCLIDLDTVGPMALAYELGDAWRSWCNPGGENQAEARFDLDLFEAAWMGYSEVLGRPLPEVERSALVRAVELVSLELSARFCADALLERYFGWDATCYRGRGEHNLARARSQWAVHRSALATRQVRARLLGVAG